MTQQTYTRQEVADALQVSVATVSRLIKRGQLRASKVGRQVRITAEALEALRAGRAQPEHLAETMTSPSISEAGTVTPSLFEGASNV